VRRQNACVTDGVKARRRDCRCKSAQQGERIEVNGDGAVAERPLQSDAHEAIGASLKSLARERRAKDVSDGSAGDARPT
jgi:hypothetical protein